MVSSLGTVDAGGGGRMAGNAPNHGLSSLFFLLQEMGRDDEGVDTDVVGGGAHLASGDREGQPFVWRNGVTMPPRFLGQVP